MMKKPGFSSTGFTDENNIVLESEITFYEMTKLGGFDCCHELVKQVSLAVYRMYNLFILRYFFINNSRVQFKHIFKCLPPTYIYIEVHIKDSFDISFWKSTFKSWLFHSYLFS